MKITEKQLLVMITTLKESLSISGYFSVSYEARNGIMNQIYNQQSDKIIDISAEDE